MDTRKVLGIIFSILFVGAFTFVLCWGIINFNKVKESMSGTAIYTQEDVNNAYQDGYDTALEDKAEYNELISGYRDTITTLNDNISKLNSQVSTLTNANNDCQTKINSLNNIISQNESTIANLNNTITTNNSTIDYLTSEINILSETKTNLETQITALNNNITNKEVIISGLNSQIVDLQNDINYKRTQIVELNNQVTSLQIELDELSSSDNKNAILIENLNSQIVNLNNEITLLENSIANKTSEIETLNTHITQLNAEISTLKAQVVEKIASITSLENQVANLRTLNSQLEQTNESNTQTISTLNTQIVNLNSQISELTLQIQNNSTNVSGLNNKIAELESSIAYYEQYIAGLESNDQVVATFEFNGSVYNIQVIPKNSYASVSTPTSDSYVTFNGWTVDGQTVDISTYVITQNTKFVADITCKYDVVFKVDGSEYNRQIVVENNLSTIPATPVKEGYEFDGWTLDGVNLVDVSTYLVKEHSVFIAKFTKLHTVNFVYENDTISTQSIRNGNIARNISVEDTVYKKFNGWKVNNMLVDITTYKITTNTTFVADITYSYDVTFSVDDNNYNTQIVVLNNFISVPVNPVKAGYTFDGWMLNNEIVNPANIRITCNTTFVAKFTKLLNVSFVVEGETISTQQIRNGEFASAINIDSTAYRIFNGWTLNNSIVNVSEYKITEDTIFVASITYKYDVTFLVDDAVFNSQIVAKNSTANLPNNPTKSGYVFDGWTTNGTDIVDVNTYKVTKNTSFIAKFTRQYTVTFKYEDNIVSTQLIRANNVPSSVNVDSTQYKVFNGWLLNGSVIDVTKIAINADTEFVASITYKYDVIFMCEDKIYNQQLVIKDGYAVLPTNPSIASCDFLGWTINGNDVVDIKSYKITAHVTFKAKLSYWATVQFKYENNVINTQEVSINKYAQNVSVESTDKKVFRGWSLDGSNIVNVSNTKITQDTTFIAVIDYYYSVNLIADNKTIHSEKVLKNSTVNYSANMEKDYYDFLGWYINNSAINLSTYKVTSDVNIVAKYDILSGFHLPDGRYLDWNTLLSNGYITVSGTSLTNITIYYGDSTFVVDDSITILGDGTNWFSSSSQGITNLIIPSSVTRIEKNSICNMQLEDLYIPSSVQYIGNFSIPGSVCNLDLIDFKGELADRAFSNCYALRTVFLPSTISKISCQDSYLFCQGNYVDATKTKIYTDCNENAIPSGWLGGWNRDSFDELEVVYNYSYEDFKFKNKYIGKTVEKSIQIVLSDYSLTASDLSHAIVYITDLQYYNYNSSGYTHVDPFTIVVGETTVYTWTKSNKTYQFIFTTQIVDGKLLIESTTDYKQTLGGTYNVRFSLDCIVYVSD